MCADVCDEVGRLAPPRDGDPRISNTSDKILDMHWLSAAPQQIQDGARRAV